MRIGFEFIDLATNDRNVLACTTGNGPKVGRYFVNVEGCHFAAERLTNAVRNSDVIICDEIGPLELKSKELIDSARKLLDVNKKVIVVVHQKLQHPLIDEFRNKALAKLGRYGEAYQCFLKYKTLANESSNNYLKQYLDN
jgi:nucleoside-triphosphatase